MDEVEGAMTITPHRDRREPDVCLWMGDGEVRSLRQRVTVAKVGTWTAAYAIIRGVTSVMLHRLRMSIGPFAFDFGSYGLLTLSARAAVLLRKILRAT